jgi:hypothetical protein
LIKKADKKSVVTVAKTKDEAVKKDTEMKTWEDEYARRIAARIAGYASEPYYDMDLLHSVTALRLYHDLILDYEVANAIGNLVIPTSDVVLGVLK